MWGWPLPSRPPEISKAGRQSVEKYQLLVFGEDLPEGTDDRGESGSTEIGAHGQRKALLDSQMPTTRSGQNEDEHQRGMTRLQQDRDQAAYAGEQALILR